MSRRTNPLSIKILDLPYSVPVAGQAIAIGPSAGSDPLASGSGLTVTQFNYSLYNAYGCGTLAPDYSARGAYVSTAIGGHGNPALEDSIFFDFTTATWSRVANSNGLGNRETDYAPGEVSGPWYDISNAPIPTHPYRTLSYLPPAAGGGVKGSVLYVTHGAVTSGAAICKATHKLDLNTQTWSRINDGSAVDLQAAEESIVFDPATNRYYMVRHNLDAYNTLPYLRVSDWTWQQTASHSSPPEWGQNSGWGSAFLYPSQSWILNHQGTNGLLRAFQLNSPSQGWTQLNVSGLPASEGNLWAYYPPDGKFYFHSSTGSLVHRLAPPASSPLSNPWVHDTFTPSGASLPDADTSGGLVSHKTRLFYVPSIQCLCWIAGGPTHVIIFKPPS